MIISCCDRDFTDTITSPAAINGVDTAFSAFATADGTCSPTAIIFTPTRSSFDFFFLYKL